MASTLPVLVNPRPTWLDVLISEKIDRYEVAKRMGEAERATRADMGFGDLFTIDHDPKTRKSNKKGVYRTAIMFLAPSKVACHWASPGCMKGCLNTAGRGGMHMTQRARLARRELLERDPALFMARLVYELRRFVRSCDKRGVKPCVRLNGTSDIPWENVVPWLFPEFSHVQFYDYTKGRRRLGYVPKNYWLTLSRSECNQDDVRRRRR